MLKTALEKASAQAQRAGQIIRSVHAFVQASATRRASRSTSQTLLDGLAPLVELQARQFFVSIQINSAPGLPQVLGDGVMLEQVLLNLTRNAIESMQLVPPARRVLRVAAVLDDSGDTPMVAVSVDRPRPRHSGRSRRAPVLAVLLDQGRRHGHGAQSSAARRSNSMAAR